MIPEVNKQTRLMVQGLGDLIALSDTLRMSEAEYEALLVQLEKARGEFADAKRELALQRKLIDDAKAQHALAVVEHDAGMQRLNDAFIAQREALEEVKRLHANAIEAANKARDGEAKAIAELRVIERAKLDDLLAEEQAVQRRIADLKNALVQKLKDI